jgi:hypothetical protein
LFGFVKRFKFFSYNFQILNFEFFAFEHRVEAKKSNFFLHKTKRHTIFYKQLICFD